MILCHMFLFTTPVPSFRTHLLKSESVVLYEVLYYDDVATVKHHLNAAPRSAIHQALSNPAHYLQVRRCSLLNICPAGYEVSVLI